MKSHRHVDSSANLKTRCILVHLGVKKGKLEQVLCCVEHVLVTAGNFWIALKNTKRRRFSDFELDLEKNIALHFKNLFPCECLLRHVDEIFHSWWIYFFILACNEQSSDSTQLNVLFFNTYNAEIPVNDIDCNEKCFAQQFKFAVHINKPIDKDGPSIFIDASCLPFHVLRIRIGLSFVGLHVTCDFTDEFWNTVDVVYCWTVDLANVIGQMTVVFMLVSCHFVLKTDFWEAISWTNRCLIELLANHSWLQTRMVKCAAPS